MRQSRRGRVATTPRAAASAIATRKRGALDESSLPGAGLAVREPSLDAAEHGGCDVGDVLVARRGRGMKDRLRPAGML